MKIICFCAYFCLNGTSRFRTSFWSPTLAGCASSLPIHFLTAHALKKTYIKYIRASALHSCFKGFEIRLRVLCDLWPFVWIVDHEQWKKSNWRNVIMNHMILFSDLDCRVRAVLLIYFLNTGKKFFKWELKKKKEQENVFLHFCMK